MQNLAIGKFSKPQVVQSVSLTSLAVGAILSIDASDLKDSNGSDSCMKWPTTETFESGRVVSTISIAPFVGSKVTSLTLPMSVAFESTTLMPFRLSYIVCFVSAVSPISVSGAGVVNFSHA